jgi:hypothetical protein
MSETETNPMDFQPELQIEVEPGKTHVLEITAKPIETPPSQEEPEKGGIEIRLVDEEGNPFAAGPVYLVGENGVFKKIEIIKDHPEMKGYGRLDNIPPGIYTVTLEKPPEEAGG